MRIIRLIFRILFLLAIAGLLLVFLFPETMMKCWNILNNLFHTVDVSNKVGNYLNLTDMAALVSAPMTIGLGYLVKVLRIKKFLFTFQTSLVILIVALITQVMFRFI